MSWLMASNGQSILTAGREGPSRSWEGGLSLEGEREKVAQGRWVLSRQNYHIWRGTPVRHRLAKSNRTGVLTNSSVHRICLRRSLRRNLKTHSSGSRSQYEHLTKIEFLYDYSHKIQTDSLLMFRLRLLSLIFPTYNNNVKSYACHIGNVTLPIRQSRCCLQHTLQVHCRQHL